MSKNVKIITPHKKNCQAVQLVKKGTWNTPWAYLAKYEYRDSIGRDTNYANYRWWKVICNSSGSDPCPAEMIIKEDWIIEQAEKELSGKKT